ncbi:MAG: hypothetical protein AB1744_11030, partial [Candidatus Zixiibacteriota bacterium]
MKSYALVIILVVLLTPVPAFSARSLSETEPISLELEAVPLEMVLQMLAQQNDLNLVVSGEVTGDVTLRLDKVDVPTALSAILSPLGYNYYVTNNVIVVKPMSVDAPEELETVTITLQYIDPITAQKALESRRTTKGRIVILDKAGETPGVVEKYKANRLLITDVPVAVNQMVRLLEEIDKPERLISIEVKIIESKVDSQTKLGFLWPSAVDATLGTSDSVSGSSVGTTPQAGQLDFGGGDWTWGTLSVAQLRLVLDLLEQSGNSKLVSDPHITTLENHEAEIKVQTVIPIATINRFTEGAAIQDIVTFQDQEVGISLRV